MTKLKLFKVPIKNDVIPMTNTQYTGQYTFELINGRPV